MTASRSALKAWRANLEKARAVRWPKMTPAQYREHRRAYKTDWIRRKRAEAKRG